MPNPYLQQRYGDQYRGSFRDPHHDASDAFPVESVNPQLHAWSHVSLLPSAVPLPLWPDDAAISSDSSDDDHADAAVGFAVFPQSVHMRQSVFRPTPTERRAVVELIETETEASTHIHNAVAASTTGVGVPDTVYAHTTTITTDGDSLTHPNRLAGHSHPMDQQREVEELIRQTRAAMSSAAAVHAEWRSDEPSAPPAANGHAPPLPNSVDEMHVVRSEPSSTISPAWREIGESKLRESPEAASEPRVEATNVLSGPMRSAEADDEHDQKTSVQEAVGAAASSIPPPPPILPLQLLKQTEAQKLMKKHASRCIATVNTATPSPQSNAVHKEPLDPSSSRVAGRNDINNRASPRLQARSIKSSNSEQRSAKRHDARHPQRPRSSPEDEGSAPWIPAAAVEPLVRSVYALLAAETSSRPHGSSIPSPAFLQIHSATPVKTTNACTALPATSSHVDSCFPHDERHADNPPIPVEDVSIAPADHKQSSTFTPSHLLPRVGVTDFHAQTGAAIPPKSLQIKTSSEPHTAHPQTFSRVTQPTTSWLSKLSSLRPTHTDTIRTPPRTLNNIIDTTPTKIEKVAKLNKAARDVATRNAQRQRTVT